MNQEQIMMVQASWAEVEPLTGKLGEAFYKKLFELMPEAEQLFEGDLRKQGDTLMSMISMAVEMLDSPGSMAAAMTSLGERHAGYGVRPQHFGPFKESLMWGLSRVLGPTFTDDLRDAWSTLFDMMATMMNQQPEG